MRHRLLIGPVAPEPTPPHDLVLSKTFGTIEGDILLRAADSWAAICRNLPTDWSAEGVLLSLAGGPAPIGLWSAPVPLIALAPDPRSRWHWARHALRRCDLIVTDARTAQRLQRLGIDRVHVPASWEEEPATDAPPSTWLARLAWPELLDVLERRWPELMAQARGRCAWNLDEELLARTWQAITIREPTDATLAADLSAALDASSDPSALRHALGLVLAVDRGQATAAERAAAACGHFARVLTDRPNHVLAGLNHAEALAAANRTAEAIEEARRMLALLDESAEPDPSLWDSGHYAPGRDVFGIQWEETAWQHAGDPADEYRAKHTLLRWRLHGLLARLTDELPHRYEAALARPDLPATRATLGSALFYAGRPADAVFHLRRAIAANPFDNAAARLLYEALAKLGRRDEQERLVAERRRLHQESPQVVPAEGWFQEPILELAGPRPRISLCLIVKDEEKNLPVCLESAADLVDEIVVVDTGSLDRTKEVAARFGARVFDSPWADSFAAARNESLRHATGDWIFWLDADDRLDADNRRKLRELLARLGEENVAYLLRILSLPDAVSGATVAVDQVRLFRHDPRIRWEYRVHEQILPAVQRAGGVARPTEIVIEHSGYHDPRLRRRKLERNRPLLLLDRAERPGDPMTLFNLAALYLDLHQPAEVVKLAQEALAGAPPGWGLVSRLYVQWGQGLHRLGRTAEALSACRQGRERFPEDGELLFFEAQLCREVGELASAEACLRRLLRQRPGAVLLGGDVGLHGYKARHYLADVCRAQGRREEAEELWRKVVAERRDFVPGWLGLAALYRDQGRLPKLEGELSRWESEASLRVAAAAVRGWLHMMAGEWTTARRLLEGALAVARNNLWLHLVLADVLLREDRDRAETARVLRAALALDPYQTEARRQLAVLEQTRPVVAAP